MASIENKFDDQIAAGSIMNCLLEMEREERIRNDPNNNNRRITESSLPKIPAEKSSDRIGEIQAKKHTLDDCCFTEQMSDFLGHTRLYTKDQKDWVGKKRPSIESKITNKETTAQQQRIHNQVIKDFYKSVKSSGRDDGELVTYKKQKKDSWRYANKCLFTCPYCYESYTYWKKHERTCTQEFKKNPDAINKNTKEDDQWLEFELEIGLL